MILVRTMISMALGCLFCGCSSNPGGTAVPSTALEERGEQLLAVGRVAEARAVFLQATAGRRRPFLASVGLARCAIREGNTPVISQAMQQVYAFAPQGPRANDLIARTHLEAAKALRGGARKQHATTAATLLARARKDDPSIPGLQYHAGMAELLGGRPAYSVPFFEAAMTESANSKDALQGLVLALKSLGQRERVIQVLSPLESEGRLSTSLSEALVWARSPKSAPASKD